MDQKSLVESGQILVRALDASGFRVRIAMWVHSADDWKLWIVPPGNFNDEQDFYSRIADIVSEKQDELMGLDVGDVLMVSGDHPAMQGIGHMISAPGLGYIAFSGNMFNNYYLPDGIIIRSDLYPKKSKD